MASYVMADYQVPEIDVNTGLGALTLLSGAVMVVRARCRR